MFLLFACIENALHPNADGAPGEDARDATVEDDGTEWFVQGHPGGTDVLFLVDDSGSMGAEQDLLAANFDAFAQHLLGGGLDVHVGVVRLGLADSQDDGRIVGEVLTGTDALDPLRFSDTVRSLGTDGASRCESGLAATVRALSEPMASGWNRDFLREDARLSVVIVSDENDNGGLANCGMGEGFADAFAPWFLSLKDDPSLVQLDVIAGFDPSDPRIPHDCEGPSGLADAGPSYAHAAELVGGRTWSICAEDWSPALDRIGRTGAGLRTIFPLDRVPSQDIADADGDGDTTEPALEVRVDLHDGRGFVLTEPVWAPTPEPVYPWSYDPSVPAIAYTEQTAPPAGATLAVRHTGPTEGEAGPTVHATLEHTPAEVCFEEGDEDRDGAIDCADADCAGGRLCEQCPVQVSGTCGTRWSVFATIPDTHWRDPVCGEVLGPDQVLYEMLVVAPQRVTVRLLPEEPLFGLGGTDAGLALFAGSCGADRCVERVDGQGVGGSETLTFEAQPFVPYHIVVDSRSDDPEWALETTCAPL